MWLWKGFIFSDRMGMQVLQILQKNGLRNSHFVQSIDHSLQINVALTA